MTSPPNTVNASPTKSFFVSMLTRDIKLEDAILDLLDNCVDGILRSNTKEDPKPYDGFNAVIKFDAESFSISDNCGGIPWSMRDYAFRMGRPAEQNSNVPRSVGVYGIGMKRAIFKIGRRCHISTQDAEKQYNIEIPRDWMEDENEWNIPVNNPIGATGSAGTTITVSDLNNGIAVMFDKNKNGRSFSSSLKDTISTYYAYIIDKGFNVTINGVTVEPQTVKIACSKESGQHKDAIMPFVFEGEADSVKVYLAVGLNGRTSSRNRIDKEREAAMGSPTNAGWTIVCNDRIVLYCDRTELTGWGEGRTPRYHTQFIGIAGIVEFKSKDPSKLPTTTTKIGVDTSSSLYLLVKNKMREGMRVFIDYTNKWKSKADESTKHIEQCEMLSLDELKNMRLQFEVTHTLPQSKQYKPVLPLPSESNTSRIVFKRDKQKIEAVAEYIGNPDMKPNAVGAQCFDIVYDETL